MAKLKSLLPAFRVSSWLGDTISGGTARGRCLDIEWGRFVLSVAIGGKRHG